MRGICAINFHKGIKRNLLREGDMSCSSREGCYYMVAAMLTLSWGAAVLADNPITSVINQLRLLMREWKHIGLLLGDTNVYLYEILNELKDASRADRSAKFQAIERIQAARAIKDLSIIQGVLPEIQALLSNLATEREVLGIRLRELQVRFCRPSGECLPKFPGFARFFDRVNTKLSAIELIHEDFLVKLEDLTVSLGTVDGEDTTGETCLNPTEGSAPLDGEVGATETLNECLDLAEHFLMEEALTNADQALERARRRLIPGIIRLQQLLVHKQVKEAMTLLRWIERDLRRDRGMRPRPAGAEDSGSQELRVLGQRISGFTVQIYKLNGQLVVNHEVEGDRVVRPKELWAVKGALPTDWGLSLPNAS